MLLLWSLYIPLRTTAEAEQKSEASVCRMSIKQMGHSTDITTSEGQFECPNKTAGNLGFASLLYFITFNLIQSACTHDKALLCLFDFPVPIQLSIIRKK